MKKNDIIEQYSIKMNVNKTSATETVNAIIDIIKDGIVSDGIVNIYQFGTINVVDVPERVRTYTMGELKGQEYTTPAHKKVKMKFSKTINDLVN